MTCSCRVHTPDDPMAMRPTDQKFESLRAEYASMTRKLLVAVAAVAIRGSIESAAERLARDCPEFAPDKEEVAALSAHAADVARKLRCAKRTRLIAAHRLAIQRLQDENFEDENVGERERLEREVAAMNKVAGA